MTNILEKACEMAKNLHSGQTRKDGKTPYIDHPAKVVELLYSWGIRDNNILAAAWLHDTIEDCNIQVDEIRANINKEVALIVSELTRWNGRYSKEDGPLIGYRKQLIGASQEAKIIKVADIIANLSDMSNLDKPHSEIVYMREKKLDDLYVVLKGLDTKG